MLKTSLRKQSFLLGFTLVELLVVIAIIGVLIALLLPAIQSARESARRTQCQNHLKQVGAACLLHESSLEHFPSGGWGYYWMGDPDRGAGPGQPGGWIYNLLPYIEQQNIHVFGGGQPFAEKKVSLGKQMQHVISIFICPSRRSATTFPGDELSLNADVPKDFAKSDYAANGGTTLIWGEGPSVDCLSRFPQCDWTKNGSKYDDASLSLFTGVIGPRLWIRTAQITDGLSHTPIVAEKYLNPNNYENGEDGSDSSSMYSGHDKDTNRGFQNYEKFSIFQPLQDTPGVGTASHRFGSAHSVGFFAVLCDGSVQLINYDIDPLVYLAMGTIAGGEGNTP